VGTTPNFKTLRVESVVELIERFTVSVRPDAPIVWRGQSCSEWGLTPSLFRSEPKRKEWTWRNKEDDLLRYFEKSNFRWLKEHYAETFIDRLTLAQHHRLPTRLLDWTEIPLIASFFACLDVAENPEDLRDGAVWRLQSNAVHFSLSEERYERERLPDGTYTSAIPENTPNGLNGDFDTFVFYPQRVHPRQINQFAAYTVHPNANLKNSSDFSQFLRREDRLVKYIFPKEIKQEAFAKLWSLGIRYENLFPDPEGAAKGAKYVVETEDGTISTERSIG
jgi:FRG domain-containing protein